MSRLPARSRAPAKQQISNSITRPSPVGGWNTRDPLSQMDPKYAPEMENFFPTASGVSLRKGASLHVTGFTGSVKTLLPFQGKVLNKLFCATDAGIYDATASGPVGVAKLARTKGEHVFAQASFTGGDFLFAANGIDAMAVYNSGTDTWSASADFTINGWGSLPANTIAAVGIAKRRVWLIPNSAQEVYYLGIDTLAGTVNKLPLGPQMVRGGYIMAMSSWTIAATSPCSSSSSSRFTWMRTAWNARVAGSFFSCGRWPSALRTTAANCAVVSSGRAATTARATRRDLGSSP